LSDLIAGVMVSVPARAKLKTVNFIVCNLHAI